MGFSAFSPHAFLFIILLYLSGGILECKKMKKILFISVFVLMVSNLAFAGGLLTNTNQHILFLRNPARGASMQIDALYSNPAGIVFMSDGFHVSLNSQSAFQTRTITSVYAPFAYYGGSATKEFKGEASAPVIPSVFALYKKDKWAFGAHFAIAGGGGKATFNRGLGSFESQIAVIPSLLTSYGFTTNQYSVDCYMEGKQLIYGIQMGAAYRIADYLSAYGGVRLNIVNNGYVGHIRDIQANVGGGEMVNLNQYFTSAAAAATQYQAAGDMEMYQLYATQAAVAEGVALSTKNKELDCEQSGWGVTPVVGLDFNMGKLNVGVKYEFNTSLDVENKTKVDDTGLYKDGVTTPHDIPALLSVGASYEILPVLRASAGYHRFLDKKAKMAGDRQKFLDHGTNEYLFGVEWDITRILQISGGLQRTQSGATDNYQNDMSYSLTSTSFGVGAGVNITERLKLNLAYLWTVYDNYTKEIANYNPAVTPALPGTDVFSRTNKVFGIGLDYSF